MNLSALWHLLGSLQLVFALKFSPVTDDIGLGDTVGRIAALADFNADTFTDLLYLNSSRSNHTILIWNARSNRFAHNPIILDVPAPLAEVRTGDFDGDGVVDILTLHGGHSEVKVHQRCYSAIVHWCKVVNSTVVVVHERNASLLPDISSPTVLDINGDHVPDIFAIACDKESRTPTFFVSHDSGTSFRFTQQPLTSYPVPDLSDLISSYFVDLDSDCLPELVLYRESNRVMEVWKSGKSGMEFKFNQSLHSSLNSMHWGMPTFADMDGDGVLEVVLFTCYDHNCNQTAVHVLHQRKESDANVIKCQSGSPWKLEFSKIVTVNLTGVSFDLLNLNLTQPVIGDLDLDGHPDVIVPGHYGNSAGLESTTSDNPIGPQRPLVLLGSAGGKLHPQLELFNEAAVANVTQVVYFDLWEDGILDILMVQDNTPRGDEDVPSIDGKLMAYRQSLSEDHTFLKVLVLSGHCFSHCESGQKPYGSVLPGATVAFSTTGRSGANERSVAVIQYSGSNSLQLPFALFGLGETPNFIEDITIGAGYSLASDMRNVNQTPDIYLGFRHWGLLVPNSQVIVSLHPIDNPKSWRIELYLTPSRLVYSTAGVLCALAVGIAIIIGLLQAREKYQDSKEKKQAKHRFHFNAM